MDTFEQLAQQMLRQMDERRHIPPEPVSASMRGEMAVLRLLSGAKCAMSAGGICQELNMTTSRMAAVLCGLEKKKMILRDADPADRRRVLVRLTKEGEAYTKSRREGAQAYMTALLRSLGEEDAATFVRLAGRVMKFTPPPPPEPIPYSPAKEDEA